MAKRYLVHNDSTGETTDRSPYQHEPEALREAVTLAQSGHKVSLYVETRRFAPAPPIIEDLR